MTPKDVLARMESPGRAPIWTIDDARAVVASLGGDISVVNRMEDFCYERGGNRADTMALMYCMTLIADKLTQENQQ